MSEIHELASSSRRTALTAMLAPAVLGAAFAIGNSAARAQATSDVDALNLMVTVEYLLAQFLAGPGSAPPPAATPNQPISVVPETSLGSDGVAGVPVRPGQRVTNITTSVRFIAAEMSTDARNHILQLRLIVGVPVVRQPLIDVSAQTGPFAAIMQQAGVAASGFNPYASEDNFLYTLLYLKNVSVAAYRGLLPTITNQVTRQNFAGLVAAESIHLATVRSLLYGRTKTQRDNADKIAAFQNSLNGGGSAFVALSARSRTTPLSASPFQVASAIPVQPTGEVAGITAARILNQLFVNSSAVTSGGFYPEGIFGNIRTSARA